MLKTILIILGIVLVIAVLLLTHNWDSPELGQRILDEVGKATGAEVKAEGFRLNLLKGLFLENVVASSQTEGREVTLSLDRLTFEHRLWPLLSGTVAIDRIHLERPQIEIVEWETGEAKPEPSTEVETPSEAEPDSSTESQGGLTLDVQEIRVTDGSFSLTHRDKEGEIRIAGLDFLMEHLKYQPGGRSLETFSADGNLSVDTLNLDHFEIRAMRSNFRLAEARFEMPELALTTDYGDLSANMNLDFSVSPFTYTFAARGGPLDLNRAVGATAGLGPAQLETTANGAGADPKAATAQGVVELQPGTFPSSSVFQQIDDALGKSVVVGNAYQATDLQFQLENGIVTLSPFQFEAERLRMQVAGTASLDGPLDFDLSVATTRDGIAIDGVGGHVLDVLSDDQGWIPIPIHISGTKDDPRVRPDGGALMAQAAGGAKREAKEAAIGAVRSRINRDR
jgi:hypothetical protein